ncbi:MAG: nitroreductase [Clostridia bacterium]|nr:nitroreductase [Clostridia bacterium]
MDIFEAIKTRHSVRSYSDKKIEPEKVEKLTKIIKKINAESGLDFQLITDEPEGFTGTMAHYGSFKGVKNYFVLAGPKKKDYEVGYYGEKLVLAAQMLGLNTCWVALTFNKRKAKYTLKKGEKLYVVISLGYGATQGKAHKSKAISDVSDMNENSPQWYKDGIEAVMLAPTAVNQQKFYFELNGDDVKMKAGGGFYTEMDLGIARYHFDIGSGKVLFEEEL